MIYLFAAFIGFPTLAVLCCIGRAWWLLSNWRPAPAQVQSADYVDRVELYGSGSGVAGFGSYQRGFAMVHEDILFEDQAGQRHVASIRRLVSRSYPPDAVYTIYYDPRRPETLTPYGPLYWLGAVVIIVLMTLPLLYMLAWHANWVSGPRPI